MGKSDKSIRGKNEASTKRVVSERLVVQIDSSKWIPASFKVSPDSRRVTYVSEIGRNRFAVVLDGKEGGNMMA
ncbi:MAG: hypothetical protein ACUVXA_07705 [Candidatus Jordarchaeum sp.]|uniref:hypothetical protein n=1 Tax=Candidatus Jordarchaeum sp. TaxID=2823881 RepID=UPI00404AD5C7